jgi:predicted amidohydrolase YtcJ
MVCLRWDTRAVPGSILVPSGALTMDARNSRVEAVGVLDGRIAAVGSAAE